MKKIFAAVLAMGLGMSAFAGPVEEEAGEYKLVYEYRASFQRIEAQYMVRNVVENSKWLPKVTDQYYVVGDSIYGYVVLPACRTCDATGVLKFNNDDYDVEGELDANNGSDGYAILTRAGNRLAMLGQKDKDGNVLPLAYKVPVAAKAGIFGAYTKVDGVGNAPWENVNYANRAWMALDINLFDAYENIHKLETTAVLPNVPVLENEYLKYGFFGLDNYEGSVILNTGFGNAQNTTTMTPDGGPEWCGPNGRGETSSCNKIIWISGSMVGYPNYVSVCDATPMWDVCYSTKVDKGYAESVNDAVVCGTWNLRLCWDLSNKATDAAIETAIRQRLGLKADRVFAGTPDVNDDWDAPMLHDNVR